MKKVCLILALMFSTSVFAITPAEVIEKLPNLKQGIVYDLEATKVKFLTTAEIAEYKDFTLEVGLSDEDSACLTVSYPILKLRDIGVNMPILKYVELNVGFTVGYENIIDENEMFYGPSITLINFDF